MKLLMLKQKLPTITRFRLFAVTAIILIFGFPIVHADQFDEQIKALQQQNSANSAQASSLAAQASSYEDAINRLEAQINSLQQSIVSTQNKIDDLNNQITIAEADLAQQKKVLGENIKAMYLEGDISALEVLASSKNLSDFVDKQQNRNAVQSKVAATLTKINDLKAQLVQQQKEQNGLLSNLQGQRAQVQASENQQASLLSFTQAQKASYDQQIKSNNTQIASLRAQQAAANARLFAGANVVLGSACDTAHGDTYPSPWCSSYQDSMLDSWGMLNRECVSYTAWKVAESGRFMPYWGGVGNANQWDEDAIADGIPVDGTPRAGDVAIKNSQPYGHAMYVESVNGDGTINISQYNANLDGRYSQVYNLSPSGLVFIHFP